MHETQALDIARHGILLALQVALPFMILTLLVGVLISLFQAVTQIQEQTLTFVPKIIVMALALLVLGPWMLHLLVAFTSNLFGSLPGAVR